jgi:short-subunit dehydrogenase
MSTSRDRGTALVTGASSGIGAEYAARLAEDGWDLVLTARRADRLDALASRLRETAGVAVETLSADLSEPEDLERVVSRVQGRDVSLLVNNAGINGYGHFPEVDPQLLTKVLAVNVTALTTLTRAAVPGMLERGRGAIVNVASVLAFAGSLPPGRLPWRAVYGGTKGYVVTFTRTLAAELADSQLNVQVLCPGLTATEFHMTAGDAPVSDDAEPVLRQGAMPAADVVTASFAALEEGEVVCVPTQPDPGALDRLADAEIGVRTPVDAGLAQRYRDAGR